MVRIGLTGGIGSGKSTVAAQWLALGAALVDTDAISRQLSGPKGAAIPALHDAFGAEAIGADGALNRERMRELAFNDAGVRQRLQALLHPLIGQEALRQAQAANAAGHPALVFDVPLLAESRLWRERVDKVLVVDCSVATQVERVMQRSGWSEAAVQATIAAQASRQARRSVADAVIHNEGLTLDQLNAEVKALWQAWVLKGS